MSENIKNSCYVTITKLYFECQWRQFGIHLLRLYFNSQRLYSSWGKAQSSCSKYSQPIKLASNSKLTANRQSCVEFERMTECDMESISSLDWKAAVRLCGSTHNIETVVALTKHQDPRVRKSALKQMCPCRVKEDVSEFWIRVFQMSRDEGTVSASFQFLSLLPVQGIDLF